MITAAQAIARLDEALRKSGESIVLEHIDDGAVSSTDTPRASVRGYRADELAEGINQGDTLVTLSPTGVATAPRQMDRFKLGGGTRVATILGVEEVRLAGVVVRYNVQARG